MRATSLILIVLCTATQAFSQVLPPLLSPSETHVLAETISGDVAMRNLEEIARHHRMRGSDGYRAAAEHLASELRGYGLSGVEILRFPADGIIYYGTQRSRPPWNVESADLWEVRTGGDRLVASWETMPMRLAQDSASGDVTAAVIDVGAGTSEADYAGKSVKGSLVLVSSQPEAVAPLALGRFGAAGILSYAQNQRTGWFGEDETLVRWGHLDTFAEHPGFAFMLSLQEARRLRERLERGEEVRMRARVRAGREEGAYEVLTAVIPGTDQRSEEIVYSCHLDHPRPGANDNASGCAAILEVARTLSHLIETGALAAPARTIRFVWPPEIEGTMALLTARPDLTARMKAAIHLDMVGGGPDTKAMFHITRGPASLPSFIYDLAQETGRWVNAQSSAHAMSGSAEYPLIATSGSKDPLRAVLVNFTMGSDHQIYSESSFGIPAIYMNDWPDRYIHTHKDVPANIDPTKLERAAFIAAASGWALANLDARDVPELLAILERNAMRRAAELIERRASSGAESGYLLARYGAGYERAVIDSIEELTRVPAEARAEAERFIDELAGLIQGSAGPSIFAPAGVGERIYRRNPALKGPMSVFGYDYLADRYGKRRAAGLALSRAGGEYTYETLNLVNGTRTVAGIQNVLSLAVGPVPVEAVAEYLEALESIGVVEQLPPASFD